MVLTVGPIIFIKAKNLQSLIYKKQYIYMVWNSKNLKDHLVKNPSRAISCVYNQMLTCSFLFFSYINDSKLSYCIVPFIIVLFVRIASFLIGSLRSNSYTIYFTHLKFTIYWTLIYAQSCRTITTVNFRTFSLPPKETSYLFVVTPVSPALLI